MEWNITTILAIYGAILSTIGVAWNIRNGLIDRARIRVSFQARVLAKLVPAGGQEGSLVVSGGEEGYVFEVVNMGRRPITISGLGFGLKDGKHLTVPLMLPGTKQFPVDITEGKAESFFIKGQGLAEYRDLIKFAWVRDATGRLYKVSGREVRKHLIESSNEAT